MCSGAVQLGVRWKTVSVPAVLATSWMVWTPVAPVPITATRLPSKLDRLLREARGVAGEALEVLDARDLRHGRGGEGADGGDQEARAVRAAVLQREVPVARVLVPVGGGHPGVEGDVAAQVELVGDDVEIFQRLGLRREMLGPVPLVEQLLAEGVAVGIALRVEPRAGVAVPVPGPADAGPRSRTRARTCRACAGCGAGRGRRSRPR